ncbi:MAG: GGDEF domain-containing protein [Elusimicrobiales bacterium]|jgi:diguanylate cyclase (GGDEF)-like protein
MNNDGLFVFLLAVSPLPSYLIGRSSRLIGLLSGAALGGAAAFALLRGGGFETGPGLALLSWVLAALAHSALINSSGPGALQEERGLDGARARTAKLEADLAALKADFAALASSEKKALTLYSAVKLLSEAVDLESAGKQFGKYARDYFDTADFAFFVYDLNSGVPGLFAAGEHTGLSSWEAVSRLAGGDPALLSSALVSQAGRTVLTPVLHAGQPVGLFVLRAAPETFRKEDPASAAQKFANEVSFAVKRIQLFRQVEWLSQVDGLTGVHRRNALDEKIGEEIRRAGAFKTTLGFMIVDIDHFKLVNDRYGHQFGDFVLKKVGLLLQSSVYETDFVGRYGGEEFGIVLPRADAAGVLRKAEAIRTKIEGENFSQGFETVRVTVSIGIAHFPRDGSTAGELISRADAALYRAKETGRNKVVDVSGI